MVDLKRNPRNLRGFILTLGRELWSLSLKEAQYLYYRLRHYKVYDEGLSEIGRKIRDYREAHHLTQKELAKELGVAKMEVLRWENGKNDPNKTAVLKLKEKGILDA